MERGKYLLRRIVGVVRSILDSDVGRFSEMTGFDGLSRSGMPKVEKPGSNLAENNDQSKKIPIDRINLD